MTASTEHHRVIVVGGGQAGLAAGFHLARAGVEFVILDAERRVGDAWRRRWDSLRLFTPARHAGLPGMPFPAAGGDFPTKDQVADYLERYAERYSLPVRHGVRVQTARRPDDRFEIDTTAGTFTADSVVIATGTNPHPRVPTFASDLAASIAQLHSHDYLRPASLPPGKVLVVGFGTSGAEIAEELAKAGREVSISGEPTMHVPDPLLAIAGGLYWLFLHRVLTLSTPIGRKAAPRVVASGAPLIRVSEKKVVAAGVTRVPRVVGVSDGRPALADGSTADADVVVWCTGYDPDYGWLDVPGLTFDDRGWPRAPLGIAEGVEGLGFVGVPFQVGLTSSLIGGVGRDAGLVVERLVTTGRSAVTAG